MNKTLIAYFSLADIVPEGADAFSQATPSVGNTEFAAIEIQNQVGGDLFAIHTVQNYPGESSGMFGDRGGRNAFRCPSGAFRPCGEYGAVRYGIYRLSDLVVYGTDGNPHIS